MNCKEFEMVVDGLAGSSVMDTAAMRKGLAHAEECTTCSARLGDEQVLASGFSALRTSDAKLETPARVEAALLSTFRDRMASGQHANVTRLPVRRWTLARWQVGALAAVAAAFVVMMTIATPRLMRTSEGRAQTETAAAVTSHSVAPSVEPGIRNDAPIMPEDVATVGPEPLSPSRDSLFHEASGMTHRMRRDWHTGAIPVNEVASSMTYQDDPELTTDFIPLTYEAAVAPPDRGRVIRVEMPRSALASFGLPVNMERANERVKADVVLGEDGLARAIRFVR